MATVAAYRRFESLHPAVGRELGGALTLETPAAAVALLALARRDLSGRVAGFPTAGVAVVEPAVEECSQGPKSSLPAVMATTTSRPMSCRA